MSYINNFSMRAFIYGQLQIVVHQFCIDIPN